MVHRLLLPQSRKLPRGGDAVSQKVANDAVSAVLHEINNRLWYLGGPSQRKYQEASLGRNRLEVGASAHLQDRYWRDSEHDGLRYGQVYLSYDHLTCYELDSHLRRASFGLL